MRLTQLMFRLRSKGLGSWDLGSWASTEIAKGGPHGPPLCCTGQHRESLRSALALSRVVLGACERPSPKRPSPKPKPPQAEFTRGVDVASQLHVRRRDRCVPRGAEDRSGFRDGVLGRGDELQPAAVVLRRGRQGQGGAGEARRRRRRRAWRRRRRRASRDSCARSKRCSGPATRPRARAAHAQAMAEGRGRESRRR